MRFYEYKQYLKEFLEVREEVTKLVHDIEELIILADAISALSIKEQNSFRFHSVRLDNLANKLFNKKHFVEP